jgi:4-hydroxy-tetrahydrodipicolinate synthase
MSDGSPAGPNGTRTSAFVISITPFDRSGALDEGALREHLRRMADAGIGVYLGGGGSGEGFTLSAAEAWRVLEIGVEELKGKVPVRSMGVEPRTAAEMVRFARMAKSVGVDATQIYSLDQGHGHRPTGAELETYLLDILGEVDLPVILSSHQSVGYALPVDMLAELVERFDQIIGINSSHADLAYLASIVDAMGGRVDVHVGGPVQTLTALSLGAQGFLTSEGNLAPKLCMSVLHHYDAGDAHAMTDSFGRLVRLSHSLYTNGGIRATKAVLNDLGLPGGYPRKPQLPVSPETVTQVRDAVDRLGVADVEGWQRPPRSVGD